MTRCCLVCRLQRCFLASMAPTARARMTTHAVPKCQREQVCTIQRKQLSAGTPVCVTQPIHKRLWNSGAGNPSSLWL